MNLPNFRRFLTKRNIWLAIILVVVGLIGYGIFGRKKALEIKESYTVSTQDVRETVIATGTVTSESELNLSFKNSGVVNRVNVKVSDQVKAGQVLALLDEKDASAAIAQANAQVSAARANLNKVLSGASDPEVAVAQVALDNAYFAWLNSTPSAQPNNENTTAEVTVNGTYTGSETGEYHIKFYHSNGGISYDVSGLGNQSGSITPGIDAPIGNGLYINFSTTGFISANTEYTVTIPNPLAADYLTNYNAYKTAEANLNAKKAAARPEDVDAAKAQVASAQASLQIAQNTYANNMIVAPIDGQITSVDIKLGELSSALKEAIVLLNQDSLHIETNVPESSINLVKVGQNIDMTLDAFGPDKHLQGQVLSIDPASKIVSGVIEFRVLGTLPEDTEIKPGMTVNLNIIIDQKPNVLAIPNRLITSKNNKKFVTVMQDNLPHEIEINTGLVGDNFTEITSGLSSGQTVIVLKAK